ncbi:hypothetical protein GQ53DRAFT_749233 [Thozetella sp. PMI_491]|nr:hypothetical protein GQ53DRAFT_749233 [Thozetella sp. PMI_491]
MCARDHSAPPYHERAVARAGDIRDTVMPVLQGLIAQTFYQLFGREAPALFVYGYDSGKPAGDRLLPDWEARVINDKANFNLDLGVWTDQYGKEGNRIDAYEEAPDQIDVYEGFKFHLLHNVEDDDKDPRIICFDMAGNGIEDNEVVFTLTECMGAVRRSKNGTRDQIIGFYAMEDQATTPSA